MSKLKKFRLYVRLYLSLFIDRFKFWKKRDKEIYIYDE